MKTFNYREYISLLYILKTLQRIPVLGIKRHGGVRFVTLDSLLYHHRSWRRCTAPPLSHVERFRGGHADVQTCWEHSLLSLSLVRGGELVEQFAVHLHEGFEHIVDESDNRLIPVLLADTIESREHDWHNHVVIFFYQRHYVLIVPEVESTFSHLRNK